MKSHSSTNCDAKLQSSVVSKAQCTTFSLLLFFNVICLWLATDVPFRCNMVKRRQSAAKARWDKLGPPEEALIEIATKMANLCKVSDTWIKTQHRDLNSLWGRLAENVLGQNNARDRFWLFGMFTDKKNELQVSSAHTVRYYFSESRQHANMLRRCTDII